MHKSGSPADLARPGLHDIAFACDDVFATVARPREAGIGFLAVPANYYDDLEVRFGERDRLIARLREAGILYRLDSLDHER